VASFRPTGHRARPQRRNGFTEFVAAGGDKYPAIVRLWESAWAEIGPWAGTPAGDTAREKRFGDGKGGRRTDNSFTDNRSNKTGGPTVLDVLDQIISKATGGAVTSVQGRVDEACARMGQAKCKVVRDTIDKLIRKPAASRSTAMPSQTPTSARTIVESGPPRRGSTWKRGYLLRNRLRRDRVPERLSPIRRGIRWWWMRRFDRLAYARLQRARGCGRDGTWSGWHRCLCRLRPHSRFGRGMG
jgi:hypothetical protein